MSKKKIFAFFNVAMLSVALMGFTVDAPKTIHFEDAACKYGQCGATSKSTNMRCKNCVSAQGKFYCATHSPFQPE
jgi:hypothetical protein